MVTFSDNLIFVVVVNSCKLTIKQYLTFENGDLW